jgi:hypothetical protein
MPCVAEAIKTYIFILLAQEKQYPLHALQAQYCNGNDTFVIQDQFNLLELISKKVKNAVSPPLWGGCSLKADIAAKRRPSSVAGYCGGWTKCTRVKGHYSFDRFRAGWGEGCLLKQPKPLPQAPVVNEELPLPKIQRTTTVFHSNKEGNMKRPRIRTSFVCAHSLFTPTQCFGNEEDTANPCRHPITNISRMANASLRWLLICSG